MAKKVWDEEINKNVDWGGDESTENLPVSGRRVQEFIKNSLANLFGYTRISGGKMLQMFTDEESAELYDSDVTKYESLLLAQVQLPNTGATVATMRVVVSKTPAQYTTKGVTEKFSFTYLSYYEDESDLSSVRGTATVKVNNMQRMVLELRSGNSYEIDLTDWLTQEVNEVQITINNNEGSTRNYVYDVNIIDMSIASTFDDTAAYNGVISFRYTPYGNILKTVHFEVDDLEVGTVETTVNNRQLTYEIPAQTHGAHKLRVWMTADVMGNPINSNTLLYEVICIEDGNTTPIIASAFFPDTVEQYETLEIPFVVYNPVENPTNIELCVNGSKIAERSVNRTRQTWSYRVNEKGELNMKIQCGVTSRTFSFNVIESIVTSEAETQDLELYLTSQGRSNQDTNKEEWKYEDIEAVFSGMNWSTNGWVIDSDGSVCLRLLGGAKVEIPFKLFSGNVLQSGKTIEVEFSVHQVTDYNAVIMSCYAGGIGLQLTPNLISLRSEQSEVSTRYKEDERVRIAFVVEKTADNRLMQIYVNGIKSQSIQYPSSDGITQVSPVGISIDGTSATVDIYNIRSYANNLTSQQMLDNYIADMDNIDKKIEVFERNQVYDSYGNLSISELNKQIPVMTIIGDLPQYKGDKKTVKIEYSDLNNPAKSFVAENVSINVQGTSSQYYPRKNYKFEAKSGFTMTQDDSHADGFTLDEDEVLPTTVFCVKADFAESSGTHNTGMADYADWLLKQAGILTLPQLSNEKIRTTVYGEPCVIFHKATESSQEEFIGKYNFNTDKGAESTFGFDDGDQSWEFLNNTSDRSLFKSADFSGDGWKDDFEARFPEDYTDVTKMSEVFAWVVSCKGNVEKFKQELSQYFDKDQLVFYYLITLVFAMVDQRAKNMFLTNYEGGKWLFIFYDNDTWCGINNEGAIAFSYNVEIHDVIGTQNVWNGEDSELWKLVEDAFADDIQELYYNLRQQNLLSYDKIIEYTNTRQSDKWCEAVYNEDGYFKYEQPLIEGYTDWSSGRPQQIKTGAYLYALQGSRDAHRRWWLYNRFKYLDSKYQAGSSLSDFATFRTYTPSEWQGVQPNADITLKSFTAMYGTIKWGSVTKSERFAEGETKKITAPDMTFNDTETIIYNASMVASLGDLSPLYVGTVDVSKAINITELIIGSSIQGYSNTNFTVLSVGTNHVLRKLDIRNCPNFTSNIEVSGCEAIEEIYATGTKTTAVNLAEGGALRILQLPNTITNLTLKNQPNLTDAGLSLAGKENIIAAVIEGTPGVDGYAFIKDCLSGTNMLTRVRLVGIDASDSDLSTLMQIADLMGIDESGNQISQSVVTGKLHATEAYEEYLDSANELFPNLVITYDEYVEIPTRTIIVLDFFTMAAIQGATVKVDDDNYTTDVNGQVFIERGSAFRALISKEGYAEHTLFIRESTSDTSNTVALDKLLSLTVTVNDQYGAPIQGVKVTLEDKVITTGIDGIAQFDVVRGNYTVECKYNDETKTSSLNVTADKDYSLTFSFTKVITDYKPIPNGNIQMLVKNYNGSVSIQVESTTMDYVINWGDGETTQASSTERTRYTHKYAEDRPYNLEVSNCANVTYCNGSVYANYEPRGLLAYWTIGNSAVNNLIFHTFEYLEYIGEDLFKNDATRTSFERCFSNCKRLTSIPEGLFDRCAKVTMFRRCFSACTALTSIPDGLFDNCPLVENFDYCFAGCDSIKRIEMPTFTGATFKASYSICSYLATVIAPQETPLSIESDTFKSSGTSVSGGFKIYVPDASVDTYKAATNWLQYADNILPMSSLPE